MKHLTLFLFAIFFSINIIAQNDYNVIKVNGTILVNENNSELQRGSVFKEDDELNFKTTNARAAVIHPSKGRFILMPNNSNVAYARANLTPSMNNISTRAGAIITKDDLKRFIGNDYVIIDESKIKVSSNTFKMDEANFFYIQYTYKNEVISKKLAFKYDTLIISKKELFTIDGWPITNPNVTKMGLHYMCKENNSNLIICSFNPIFPDSQELLKEIEIILSNCKQKSNEEIINEVSNYINEMYGKIDIVNVKEWLLKMNKI
jgi:hypothetical protein